MRELLTSETGKALYARQKATVEPVFGQIKDRQSGSSTDPPPRLHLSFSWFELRSY